MSARLATRYSPFGAAAPSPARARARRAQHLGHALERQREWPSPRLSSPTSRRPMRKLASIARSRALTRPAQVRIEALAAALERVVAAVARVLGEPARALAPKPIFSCFRRDRRFGLRVELRHPRSVASSPRAGLDHAARRAAARPRPIPARGSTSPRERAPPAAEACPALILRSSSPVLAGAVRMKAVALALCFADASRAASCAASVSQARTSAPHPAQNITSRTRTRSTFSATRRRTRRAPSRRWRAFLQAARLLRPV